MADIETALIAGGVALLGGFLGQYVYAGHLAKRAHRADQLERLRQDRIQAYSDFAGALIEYRRMQLTRWFTDHDKTAAQDDVWRVREESRLRRAAALDRYYRVRLLADSEAIRKPRKKHPIARMPSTTPPRERRPTRPPTARAMSSSGHSSRSARSRSSYAATRDDESCQRARMLAYRANRQPHAPAFDGLPR